MTNQEMPPVKERRVSRLGLYLPPLLLAGAAAALSAYWFVSSRNTAAAIDDWMAIEAKAGRLWACGDRTIAGYPFRLEMICASPSLKIAGEHPLTITFNRLLAVSQIYQPSLIIAEAEGPLRITNAEGGVWIGAWSMLHASLHIDGDSGADRLAIEAAGLKTSIEGSSDATSMDHAVFHLRKTAGLSGKPGDFEIDASFDHAVFAGLQTSPDTPPLSSELQMRAEGGAVILDGTGLDGVETWRKAGGRLMIANWSIMRGEATMAVQGELALDDQKRPSGKIEFAATGFENLLKSMGLGLFAGLSSPDAKGVKTVKLPFRLTGGRLLLGPLKLAELPPLY